LNAEQLSEDIPDEHKTCIYRIVQEELHNITRHAKAKSVRIHLSQSADNLLFTIQDDGQGFLPEREKGVGLLGMYERVRHLYGSFQVRSSPGEGTLLQVELPLTEKNAPVLI
jgi:signal transduction histidine kinase